MATKVPKQQETRNKINKLRYAEYYNLQPVLDGLYAKSAEEKKFANLMPLITSEANILFAYRSIKRNSGSLTPGMDKRTIQDIEQLEPVQVVETVRKRLANYVPGMVKRVEIPKPKGTVTLPKSIRRGTSFRDAAFMGVMRRAFYGELKKRYPDVSMTYGYITKNTRIKNRLPKEHYVDARCISGNPSVKPLGYYFYQKKVRRHNRQIHKSKILKGGVRKRNQAAYLVKGFRLFDQVTYNGASYFIFGRRNSGFFDIRDLNGEKVNKGSVSYKKITLVEKAKGYLTETRKQTA